LVTDKILNVQIFVLIN